MSVSKFNFRRILWVAPFLIASTFQFSANSAGAAITSHTISVSAQPDAFVGVGPDIWVASCSGNAVTEINETTGQVIQSLTDTSYGFDCPEGLAFDGTNIWVANDLGSSITELNASTGSLVQILTGPGILNPDALAFDGTNIWVANNSQNDKIASFLSEFNAAKGSNIRTLIATRSSKWSLMSPTCLAVGLK
jgi:DNA-binding beta-propeller fold protein YncE